MNPLVTCICPTMASRRAFLPRAIECFERQTYAPRELVILADHEARIPRLPDVDIYVIHMTPECLGEKRNWACRLAAGKMIAHWDDDDYSGPGRLADQVERLQRTGASVTGYHTLLFRDFRNTKVVRDGRLQDTSGWWRWRSSAGAAAGTSLCFHADWWARHPFEPVHGGEDDRFWRTAVESGVAVSADGRDLMYATNHEGNMTQRLAGGVEWEELPGNPYGD